MLVKGILVHSLVVNIKNWNWNYSRLTSLTASACAMIAAPDFLSAETAVCVCVCICLCMSICIGVL